MLILDLIGRAAGEFSASFVDELNIVPKMEIHRLD